MSTWVIGDVHGCHRQLRELYQRLDFDTASDSLWLTGDLVNRGPKSAKVLRWCSKKERKLGERFQCVLGNHDLHALAIHHGVGRDRPGDTLEELLGAEDREELFDWLLHRPFLVRGPKTLLVHAGLLPEWTASDAAKMAGKLQRELLANPAGFIRGRISRPKQLALGAMTRMRALDSRGRQASFSGPLSKLPRRLTPWFRLPDRRTREKRIVCGHWAAIGVHHENNVTLLDSGCVWGGRLSALRLEDGEVVQVPGRR